MATMMHQDFYFNRRNVMKQLMHLPSNEKCADCSAPTPKVVNLAFRTFICEECATVHMTLFKEFMKHEMMNGLRHVPSSSFSEKEVKKMKSENAGNEAVNKLYLALYDPSNPKSHVQPKKDSDMKIRKSWIWHKYIKKAWFRGEVSVKEIFIDFSRQEFLKNEKVACDGPMKLEIQESKLNKRMHSMQLLNMALNKTNVPSQKGLDWGFHKQNEKKEKLSPHLNIHEVILELMSLPHNMVCVDCSTESPKFIDMTHQSFICNRCAKLHKSLSHEVVQIGKHKFNHNDILRLRQPDVGNEYVNQRYLNHYNPKKDDKPPNGLSGSGFRMSWLMRKYVAKKWYRNIDFQETKRNHDIDNVAKCNEHDKFVKMKSYAQYSQEDMQIMGHDQFLLHGTDKTYMHLEHFENLMIKQCHESERLQSPIGRSNARNSFPHKRVSFKDPERQVHMIP